MNLIETAWASSASLLPPPQSGGGNQSESIVGGTSPHHAHQNRSRPMTVFTVGKARIARIEETYGPTYRAGDIFPEFDDKVLAKHAGWLAPSHYDAASGFIKLSVHSWLLQIGNQKILIDGCCGNNKIKPARPFWNMLNIPYLERLAAAGARPDEIDFVM